MKRSFLLVACLLFLIATGCQQKPAAQATPTPLSAEQQAAYRQVRDDAANRARRDAIGRRYGVGEVSSTPPQR